MTDERVSDERLAEIERLALSRPKKPDAPLGQREEWSNYHVDLSCWRDDLSLARNDIAALCRDLLATRKHLERMADCNPSSWRESRSVKFVFDNEDQAKAFWDTWLAFLKSRAATNPSEEKAQ